MIWNDDYCTKLQLLIKTIFCKNQKVSHWVIYFNRWMKKKMKGDQQIKPAANPESEEERLIFQNFP